MITVCNPVSSGSIIVHIFVCIYKLNLVKPYACTNWIQPRISSMIALWNPISPAPNPRKIAIQFPKISLPTIFWVWVFASLSHFFKNINRYQFLSILSNDYLCFYPEQEDGLILMLVWPKYDHSVKPRITNTSISNRLSFPHLSKSAQMLHEWSDCYLTSRNKLYCTGLVVLLISS